MHVTPGHGGKGKNTGQFARTGYLALFPRLLPPLWCCLFCLATVSHKFLSPQLLSSQVEKMVCQVHRIEKQAFKQASAST
jgi:peptidoglycan/LPS O-acetylase OafA/YrhL